MRIAIASSGLGHVARGVEAWAEDLARALFDRGEDVTLFKGGGEAKAPYERVLPCWQRGAVKTQRLMRWMPRGAWRVGLGSAMGIEQLTFGPPLLAHLRRERIDILHVQEPHIALLVQRAQRLGLVRAAAILGHGTEEPLEVQRKFTYLQHLAPWDLERARAQGVWKPTWTAIPNFIDTDLFHPGSDSEIRKELGIPQEALIVLSVAAVKRSHKRIDYVIEEFRQVRAQNPSLPAWLVIAGGREPDTDEVMKLGRQALGDRVRFLLNFPRQRMPQLYRAADVFVLASLREMFGIVVLEASASGLPCLVHRHPVLEWVIGPGGEALDLRVPGSLAGALGELFTDSEKRKKLGERARQYCMANFSQERVVAQMIDYYRFVDSQRRSRYRAERSASTALLSTP